MTAVVFLLQLTPWTGIFLMFLLAPFWSIVTVNFGFLFIIFEALALRRISPLWLILPFGWFGGYAATAFLSHQGVAALDAEARAHNARERTAFQSSTQALVFDVDSPDLSAAPDQFARSYRLPVAYGTDRHGKTAAHRASRILTDPLCQTIKADRNHVEAGIFISWFHETARSLPRHIVKGMCAVSMPEDPELPTVFVKTRREKHEDLITPYTLTYVTIYDTNGVAASPVAGHAQPLAWLPMPVMGCGLNSSRPSRDCVTGFWRDHVGFGGQGAYGGATLEVIGEALGLEKTYASERRDEIAATAVPSIEAIVSRRTDLSLKVLDEVIADPKRRITIHDVKGLAERPALLQGRSPAMVEAMGRALANGRASYETARVLQHILAHLPGADFDAIGPALLAVLAPRPSLNDDTVARPLASRLGQLGPSAVPLLERMTFARPKRPFAAAILGLCRAGPQAAPLAERIAQLAPAGNSYDRDLDVAVYVALMRMGRADIVEREKTANTRFTNIRPRIIARAITPTSPPSVCADEGGLPHFPD